MFKQFKVGAIIPAYNEEGAIFKVVSEIAKLNFQGEKIFDDIVVCDNDSTDATARYAEMAGARVVKEQQRGYGNACLAALAFIHEVDIIVFIDGDGSIVTKDIIQLLQKINDGYDLALGAREPYLAEKGALLLHQKFGNRLIVLLIRLLWKTAYRDLGPLRAIKVNALKSLKMSDKTYGWTLEMQIKAIVRKLKVYEVPINYQKRIGKSKISGTLKGSFLAMYKMLKMLLTMYFEQLLIKKVNNS